MSTETASSILPAVLDVIEIGHPVLRQHAKALSQEELASTEIQSFIDALIATKRDRRGAGIAANQVGRALQICIVEVAANNPRYPYKPAIPLTVLVNPQMIFPSDESFMNFEGCLSVPNLRGKVQRFAQVQVQALDRDGKPQILDVAGISAGTFQHEIDHLQGVLFIDRVQDPASFCTWENFETHHRAAFVDDVKRVIEKYGS